jgi:serralysin
MVVWSNVVALSAVAFQPSARWSTTASGPTGFRGTAATLTWSLVPDGTEVRGREPSTLVSLLDRQFNFVAGGNDFAQRPWFDLLAGSFARWSELGGVTFIYEPHDDGATHSQSPGVRGERGDIRLVATSGDGLGGTLAVSQFPDGADIGFDRDDLSVMLDPAANYRRFRNVLMHEIGHTLGLNHVVSSDAAFLMEPDLDISFDGPQIDDIRGLEHLYGDRFETANGGAGNNSMTTATPLGQLSLDVRLALGGDAGDDTSVDAAESDFLSISGALNPDVYAFEIAAPALLDVLVVPRGGRFHQAVDGGPELLNDAFSSSDLAFSVLADDATLLADVNAQPAGRAEMADDLFLPAGQYFLQITGSREVVQLYELQLSLEPAIVPEPPTITATFVFALFLCAIARGQRSFLIAKSP